MQKTAEITEDSMLWLPMRLTFLPQSTNSLTLLNVTRSSSCSVPRSSLPPSLPPSPTPPLQICVGKNEEIDGFLRLSSGKKRGLVPVTYLLEI